MGEGVRRRGSPEDRSSTLNDLSTSVVERGGEGEGQRTSRWTYHCRMLIAFPHIGIVSLGTEFSLFFCASVSYLQDSRLRRCFRLWCDCEFSVYNFRIFVGCFNVVITDVRDVALFVGVLSAG